MGPLFFDWLLHPALLYAGALFVSVPIVLHLAMRQKPKPMIFPALRLVQARRETNRRRMRLRHLLLLLLRCLAIALLAAAFARPIAAQGMTGAWIAVGLLAAAALALGVLAAGAKIQGRPTSLSAALAGLAVVALVAAFVTGLVAVGAGAGAAGASGGGLGAAEEPVAAALIVDTSVRMSYREDEASLLEEAVKIAGQLLDDLPAQSEVAVLDTRPGAAWFAGSVTAAERELERLRITNTPAPLTETIDGAVELLKTSDKPHREVYIFSDMTSSSWTADTDSLARKLEKESGVRLFVIDVGVAEPKNAGLGEPSLSAESLSPSSELSVRVGVASVGEAADRVVELHLEEPDPTRPVIENGKVQLAPSKRRGRREVKLEAGAAQSVGFEISGLKGLGTYQGQLRLVGADPLAIDDVRYFSFQVAPARRVLIVAGKGANPRYLTEALAPYQLRETGRAAFDCQTIDQERLANETLEDYSAVCLLDPSPLTPDEWRRLIAYTRAGGAVSMSLGPQALGRNALPHASFLDPAAKELLGAALKVQTRAVDGAWFLAPRTLEHAVLAEFRPIATTVPWRGFPVYKYWRLADLARSAVVAMPFDNGEPALYEHGLGKGTVLVLTTPISDSTRSWNELPTGENAWPYYVLANSMFAYLVDRQGTRMNYYAGETAVLGNRADTDPQRYQLFAPEGSPQEVAAHDGRLTVRFTEHLGAYRLKGYRETPVIRGFAVNLPLTATKLDRIDAERLDETLGAGRYQLLKDVTDLERVVGKARQGPELFPFLIFLAAIVLAAEGLLANLFYKQSGKA
jgi:uncharacterized spore protein YtfJ